MLDKYNRSMVLSQQTTRGGDTMTISDTVRMALQKGGKQQRELAEDWGFTTPQALGVKFNRGSWSANDLANIAEYTGGQLVIRYPDGQDIIVFPESKPRLRGKNDPKEQAED